MGVAGGIPDENRDIRLGDVLVSKPTGTFGGVFQFDKHKTLPNGKIVRLGQLNAPPEFFQSAANILIMEHTVNSSQIPNIIQEMIMKNLWLLERGYGYDEKRPDILFPSSYVHVEARGCSRCDLKQQVSRTRRRNPKEPEIHYGTIGSSNQLVKDAKLRDRLKDDLGVIGLEMEAAGIFADNPCLVIRGVSDYADSHKNDNWKFYSAATAAAYAIELISTVPIQQPMKRTRATVKYAKGTVEMF